MNALLIFVTSAARVGYLPNAAGTLSQWLEQLCAYLQRLAKRAQKYDNAATI